MLPYTQFVLDATPEEEQLIKAAYKAHALLLSTLAARAFPANPKTLAQFWEEESEGAGEDSYLDGVREKLCSIERYIKEPDNQLDRLSNPDQGGKVWANLDEPE